MHLSHTLHYVHQLQIPVPEGLLTARDVQQILQVDRSTVYRMAEDGRLPAIRVGRSWRFAPTDIAAVLGPNTPAPSASSPTRPAFAALCSAVVEVAAELLGVSLVITDMTGAPMTEVANPCQWFTSRQDDPDALTGCVSEWAALANETDLTATFRVNHAGFQCARSFLRAEHRLIGMVIAGGIAPPDTAPAARPDLHHLTDRERARVLQTLPRIAATISTHAPAGA